MVKKSSIELEILAIALYSDRKKTSPIQYPYEWLSISVAQRNYWRITAAELMKEEQRYDG